jgi:outer membrane protein assembly factor BamB
MEGKKILLFLLVSVLLPDIASAAWTSFRGDDMNSGSSEISISGSEDLGIDLEIKGDGSIQGAVIGTENLLAFNTLNGSLYITNSEGELIFKRQVAGELFNSPMLDMDRNSVVISTSEGEVLSYNIDNGSREWNISLGEGASIHSSPNIKDGRIIVTSYDSNVYCIDSGTGKVIWTFTGCGGQIHTTPSFLDGFVYFGSCDGKLYALYLDNGSEAWSFQAEYIPSSPAVNKGRVFFGSFDERFYCLEAKSGDMIWNVSHGSSVFSSPAVSEDVVCFGTDDGYLHLHETVSGSELWSTMITDSSLETGPVLIKDHVIVTFKDGLLVVSMENGSIERGFELGDSSSCSPSVIGGKIFFGDSSGFVRSVEEIEGDHDNTYEIGVEDDPERDLIVMVIGIVIIISVGIFLYIGYLRIRTD